MIKCAAVDAPPAQRHGVSITNEAVHCNISHNILSTHDVAYRKRAYICVFLSHNVRTWMG